MSRWLMREKPGAAVKEIFTAVQGRRQEHGARQDFGLTEANSLALQQLHPVILSIN